MKKSVSVKIQATIPDTLEVEVKRYQNRGDMPLSFSRAIAEILMKGLQSVAEQEEFKLIQLISRKLKGKEEESLNILNMNFLILLINLRRQRDYQINRCYSVRSILLI